MWRISPRRSAFTWSSTSALEWRGWRRRSTHRPGLVLDPLLQMWPDRWGRSSSSLLPVSVFCEKAWLEALLLQNGQKQPDPGSLEDLSRDETDRAVPLSEPVTIPRKSPLIRNHKTGSMEVRLTQPQITIFHRPAAAFIYLGRWCHLRVPVCPSGPVRDIVL